MCIDHLGRRHETNRHHHHSRIEIPRCTPQHLNQVNYTLHRTHPMFVPADTRRNILTDAGRGATLSQAPDQAPGAQEHAIQYIKAAPYPDPSLSWASYVSYVKGAILVALRSPYLVDPLKAQHYDCSRNSSLCKHQAQRYNGSDSRRE